MSCTDTRTERSPTPTTADEYVIDLPIEGCVESGRIYTYYVGFPFRFAKNRIYPHVEYLSTPCRASTSFEVRIRAREANDGDGYGLSEIYRIRIAWSQLWQLVELSVRAEAAIYGELVRRESMAI